MTGEGQSHSPSVAIDGLDDRILENERRLPQPGGREAAPGELALLQSFVNTHFDLADEWGADRLATPGQLEDWLVTRRLIRSDGPPVGPAHLERVVAVREGLRELARGNRDPSHGPDPGALDELNRAANGAYLGIALGPDRLVLAPRGNDDVDRALGLLLALAARAMIDGRWARLKACPGEHCGWVFYDHSRNNSGRWCSMAVCGGRTKARSHYRRTRMRTASVSG